MELLAVDDFETHEMAADATAGAGKGDQYNVSSGQVA
jgi:hypothetical protein